MIECLSALCVLGVVIVALLLMTHAISVEQAVNALGRALVILILAIWAMCILKSLIPLALSMLRALVVWTAIIGFLIGGTLALAVVLLKLAKPLANRIRREERGEPYE